MSRLEEKNIYDLEKFYRRNLINSLSGFKSANLIGTMSANHVPNLAIFTSVHYIGANPPLLGFNVRPATVPRHTYENILSNGFFTINHISENHYKQAHEASARYRKDISEFDMVGLTPEYSSTHPAPYVEESPVKIGLQLEEFHKIKANSTTLVVGKIIELIIPDRIIRPDGTVRLEKLGVVTVSGLDTYHSTNELAKLPYAKPR